MPTILDNISVAQSQFTPTSVDEFFALTLALRLDDPKGVHHFARLISQSSRHHLLAAYRRALNSHKASNVIRNFHVELEHTNGNGGNGQAVKLMAIRVERRSIGAALFIGEKLDYTASRELSSVREKALESALVFVEKLIHQFELESAAIETVMNGSDTQRRILSDAITTLFREQMLPVWEIDKHSLFEAFASPALATRKELRSAICAIWPGLAGMHSRVFVQDAVALGLYVQVERLFIN